MKNPDPLKILATVAFWSFPIAAVSGGMYGDLAEGAAIGLAIAGLCLLTIITIDIWKQ